MSSDKKTLEGRRVAFLATDGVERVELVEPWKSVQDSGGQAVLVAPHGAEIRSVDGMEPSGTFVVDLTLDEARPEEFDALVLPGGVANPDQLRLDSRAVDFVRAFFDAEKPTGVICHGPWTLIEAGVARGRTLTSYPSLATDLRNAGASWVDREVCVDGPLVTSRRPDDLPAFCAAIVQEFSAGRHRPVARPAF